MKQSHDSLLEQHRLQHWQVAWNSAPCTGCAAKLRKRQPVVRARTYFPMDEFLKKYPAEAAQLYQQHGKIPAYETTEGSMVLVGEAFACRDCKVELAQQAARAPSWVLVEFDEGPNPDNYRAQLLVH